MSGAISGSGSLVKDNTGTLTLTAANSYTGATSVNGGILSLGDGTANTSLADASDMILATGAVLNLNFTGTDTIDELFLGGLQVASGTWGATGSGATNIDDTYFTGTGTLTVGVAGPAYDIWAYDAALTGANININANSDGDSLVNLLEFAFGTDPNTSDASVMSIDGSSFTPGLPTVNTDFAPLLRVKARFIRLVDHANSGITYTAQFSHDLNET